ncbi:MAG: carboxypeptidase-like regulatory domain-containing protein, partial [Bacteroidota bacterium]|nr:carboxypeptidase-like regulatory domain-containing protein [Bacteroidota bacterium]
MKKLLLNSIKWHPLLMLVLGVLCLQNTYAQENITIEGNVSAAGETAGPLPYITILVKGTTRGTTTDFDGNYSISASPDATLVFSYVGFKTKEIAVDGQTQIDVQLEEDIAGLDAVVVTGYSTQDKKSITGSIATITSEDLEKVHGGATVSSGLAGKIPGVSFRMNDGRPGASASIQIRNMGTPLYVIDGIQQDEGQFNNISPNDIESITVLKDASAAVYG